MIKKRVQYQINILIVLLVVLLIVQCGTPEQEQTFLHLKASFKAMMTSNSIIKSEAQTRIPSSCSTAGPS